METNFVQILVVVLTTLIVCAEIVFYLALNAPRDPDEVSLETHR